MDGLTQFTPIGRVSYRDDNRIFGIKPKDRLYHIHCLGKTGMGKSNLLINFALDDAEKGNGFCVIDPHGDTVQAILSRIPEFRKKDLIYFDATNRDSPPAFNPLGGVLKEQRQLVASEMITTFSRLFADAWGSKLERIMRMAILTMLETPNSSLLDINALLSDKNFRNQVISNLKDPSLLAFWNTEYQLYSPSVQSNTILPILNKVGVLLDNQILRNIFGQTEGLSFDKSLKENKIVLCNLSKGVVGEDGAIVLGSFLITSIQNAIMRRATIPQQYRHPFYLFIDEAQNFVSTSLASMLPQVRKYGLGLFLANQHLDQLEQETRNAILGNVGTLIAFRVGLSDAKVLEKEFYPRFKFDDFISLPLYHIYLKLTIDGMESRGFSAVTLPLKN